MTRVVGVGIAVTALFLRAWHLRWGLADGCAFPDEIVPLGRALPFLDLSWRSFDTTDFVYPTLAGYLAGLATAVMHALGFVRPVPAGFFDIIGAARLVTAAGSVGTVALVWAVGTRAFSRPIGIAAAALMAVVPLEVLQAHYASVDPLLVAWGTLALLLCLGLAAHGGLAIAALAGGAGGLAFGTKYTGIAALVPVAVAIALHARATGTPTRALGLGVAAATGFVAAFALACPPCLLHGDALLRMLRTIAVTTATPPLVYLNNRLSPEVGWYGRPYLYQLVASLPFTLGWPLYLASLLGVGVALRRRTRADLVLLAALVPHAAVIGASRLTFPRYLLPMVPVLVVLASRALLSPGRWRRARTACLVAVWVYTVALAASLVHGVSYEQQADLARWVATHLPPGSSRTVAFPATFKSYFGLEPFLRREGLTPAPAPEGRWLDGAPDALVVPEWLAIGIRRDRPASADARTLDLLASGGGGYRAAARWPYWFLQHDLYAWLDPGLLPGLGSYGFTVYLPIAGEATEPR